MPGAFALVLVSGLAAGEPMTASQAPASLPDAVLATCIQRQRTWSPGVSDAWLDLKCGGHVAQNGRVVRSGEGAGAPAPNPTEGEPPPELAPGRDPVDHVAEGAAPEHGGRRYQETPPSGWGPPRWLLGAVPGLALGTASGALLLGSAGLITFAASDLTGEYLANAVVGMFVARQRDLPYFLGGVAAIVAVLGLGALAGAPLAAAGSGLGWWLDGEAAAGAWEDEAAPQGPAQPVSLSAASPPAAASRSVGSP